MDEKQALLEEIRDLKKAIAAAKKEENFRRTQSDSYSSRITIFRAKTSVLTNCSLQIIQNINYFQHSFCMNRANIPSPSLGEMSWFSRRLPLFLIRPILISFTLLMKSCSRRSPGKLSMSIHTKSSSMKFPPSLRENK